MKKKTYLKKKDTFTKKNITFKKKIIGKISSVNQNTETELILPKLN